MMGRFQRLRVNVEMKNLSFTYRRAADKEAEKIRYTEILWRRQHGVGGVRDEE